MAVRMSSNVSPHISRRKPPLPLRATKRILLGFGALLLRLLRTARLLALHAPKACPNSRWGRGQTVEPEGICS